MVRGPHGHFKQVNWIAGEADLTLGSKLHTLKHLEAPVKKYAKHFATL